MEQIGFVNVRAQMTNIVQATIACSSSAMLEQAQLDTSNGSSCVERWRAKWSLGL